MAELGERYQAAKQALFNAYYETKLNPQQREAVCTVNGPLLILAGAGSGKTTVLVRRIVHIIKYGNAYYSDRLPPDLCEESVRDMERAAALPPEEIEYILPEFIADPCPPWAVLAITFTNKAAREIRERLQAAFDDPAMAEEIWAGTFHSVCVRILRRYGDRLGYAPNFSIYDTDEKKRLILSCMKKLNIEEKTLPVRSVMTAISHEKDNLRAPSDMNEREGNLLRRRQIKAIYTAYQEALRQSNALDFDDIIMKTVELLESQPDVLGYYQNRFRYVCVDEYQDTNYAQFRLTELLSGGRRNIMVVGDDDQSIYKFRGATVENILNFDKTYPDARVIKLEQNYRSTQIILRAANAVIAHNTMRHEKALWCAAGEGDRIVLHESRDGYGEAAYIINKIMELVVREKRHYRDFAVLYRVNELARGLESAFAKSGLPYRVLGSQRFYDRKEIRDVIAYLVLIANGRDDQKLKRVINEPKRKIGTATVDAIESLAAAEGVPMFDILGRAGDYVALGKSAPRLTEFYRMIVALREMEAPPSRLMEEVLARSGYLQMLQDMGEEGQSAVDNVNELISAAVEYEARAEGEATLSGFLEEVALVSDVDKYDEQADAVVLMTIHSAKGLEFPVVFLAGMEEGIFPGTQSVSEPEELGEERRLAYVAITRAKERLFLTCAHERMLYGRTQYNPVSRFAEREIPPKLLTVEEDDAPRFGHAYSARPTYPRPSRESIPSGEPFRRPAPPRPAAPARLERFAPGARVVHATFGAGTVTSMTDMGGDILYEVHFDSGESKKLMATYARLKRA